MTDSASPLADAPASVVVSSPMITEPVAYRHEPGPRFEPTSALARGPVISPPHTVDGVVKQFLHELNSGQGVPLARA